MAALPTLPTSVHGISSSVFGHTTTNYTIPKHTSYDTLFKELYEQRPQVALNTSTLHMLADVLQIDNANERYETELADIRNEYNNELRKTLEMMIHLANPKLRELKDLYRITKDNIDVANKLTR